MSRRWLAPVSTGGAAHRQRWATAGAYVLAGLVLGAVSLGSGVATARPAQERTSVSSKDAATLARDAATDDEALRRLRAVDRIGGRPVDLDAALADLAAQERPSRLRALAGELDRPSGAPSSGSTPTRPSDARLDARRVLDGAKYQPKQLPRPFKGALDWAADRLRPVGRFLAVIFGPIGSVLGLLPAPVVVILAGLAVGLGVWWLARRRSGTALETPGGAGRGRLVDAALDPAELEAQAEAAETAGELAAAVRLRYQAGLIRLVRAERLALRADTTASDAAAQVDDPTVSSLTADFEAVAYGGRAATAVDVERSRAGWLAVLGTRSRR